MSRAGARLRQSAGETIGETLAAILIVAMSFVFLAGAVVSAARVNATLTAEEIAFRPADAGSGAEETVSVYGTEVPVLVYEGNGYVYYVPKS